jgi:signal transduction histidine kinase
MKHEAIKLRTRIGFHFLGLVSTWTLFVMVLLGHRLSEKSEELFRGQGAELAHGLAVECAPFVRHDELASLSDFLTERMHRSFDLRYIIVRRGDGEVLASTFPAGIPVDLLHLSHTKVAQPDVRVQLIDTERERLYDYTAEASNVQVQMGLSLTSVQLFAQEVTMYMLWIGVAAFLAVLGVTLHVSRPVEALATAIATQSGVPVEAAFDGTLETSALAGWFAHMSQRLDESARRLDQSKKLAYLGEIAASIAHEVNNPLGIIALNSGFLTKRVAAGEVTGPATNEIERVRAAASRATFAAQQLLQVARYSTRSTETRRKAFRPKPMIAETVDLLRDRIRVSRCNVTMDVSDDLPSVSLDQQGVQQVLFNLLTNAIDATPPDKNITVSAQVTEDSFVLTVVDQGKGMNEELLQRATDPFVTTKDAGKGTGLGLAISDSIVRGHGGKLVLASAVGTGTTATVSLPLDPP